MDLDRGEDTTYSPRLTEMAIIDENASNQSVAEHFIGLLLINGMRINPKRVIMFPDEESRFEFESICSDGNIQTFEIKDVDDRTICKIGINYRDIMFEFATDSELFNSVKKLFPNATDEDDYIGICLNKDAIQDSRSFCEIMCGLEGDANAREKFLSEVLSKLSLRMIHNAHQLGKSDEEIMEALNFKIRSNPDNLQKILNLIHDHCRDLEWETFRRELTEQGAIDYVNALTKPEEIREFFNRRGFVVSMTSVWNAIAKNPNTPLDVLLSLAKRVRITRENLKNIVLNRNMTSESIPQIFRTAQSFADEFEREVKNEMLGRCMNRDNNISVAVLYKFLSSITPEVFDVIAENRDLVNDFVAYTSLADVISRGRVTDKFIESLINSDYMPMETIEKITPLKRMSKELLSLVLDKIDNSSKIIERLDAAPNVNKNYVAGLKVKFINSVLNVFKNINCDENLKARIRNDFGKRIKQYKEHLDAINREAEEARASFIRRQTTRTLPVNPVERTLQRNHGNQSDQENGANTQGHNI